MVLILGIMLLIPGIQVSVYAIPVWLLVMFLAYAIKSKRRPQVNGTAAGTAAK
ncbi:aromatic amino acid transporter [compost metagenome]